MKHFLSLLILVTLIAFPLSAVAGQGAADTVVIRGLGNITTFNPVLAGDGASLQAYSILWPAPAETDSETGKLLPGLTSWKVSDDGLTYTFTIRKDANWSDGKPITSADMKFVIDAIKSDKVKTGQKANAELIKDVKIVDDKTYQIVLSQASCTAMSDFAGFRFLPSYRFKEDFSDFETNTLNTKPDISGGPYILEDWKPDEYQRYKANPTYWKGQPHIAHLVNRVLQDPTLMLQALQAGEIDYANMQGDLFQQLTKKDNLQFKAFPQITVSFLMLNWADPTDPQPAYDKDGKPVQQKPHPIFSDKRVRQAVAMGYNKEDILKTMGGKEGGTLLVGPVVPALTWAYNTAISPYPYDPKKAAALLDEAGWKLNASTGIREKNGKPLKFDIAYSDLIKSFETTALVAQDQLKQLGMDVTLKKMEWAAYIKEVYLGQKFDASPISNSGTGVGPDPNDFLQLVYSKSDVPGSGSNPPSYVNPAVDKLIEQGRTVKGCGESERAKIYKDLQRITHDDVAYDWTFTPNLYQIATKRIGNFKPSALWVYYGYSDHVQEWTINK
jgi:peptide/nickel transport system substrate-binding protein